MTLGGLLDGGWSPERPRKDEKLGVSASRRSIGTQELTTNRTQGGNLRNYAHTSVHVNLQEDTHVRRLNQRLHFYTPCGVRRDKPVS